MPVAFQMMRFPFVCQLNVKDLFQSINQLGIADGKRYLDAMTQIASHEVGAAEINLLVPSIPKIVDTAVLQEPAYDAADADIVTESADRRPQAAKSTYSRSTLTPACDAR